MIDTTVRTSNATAAVEDTLRHVETLLGRLQDQLAALRAEHKVCEEISATEGCEVLDWQGTRYIFSPKQAAVVRQLLDAWKRGRPEVPQSTLLRRADSESRFLFELFKRTGTRNRPRQQHPAWKTLIVTVGRGLYRLAVPLPSERDAEGDRAA